MKFETRSGSVYEIRDGLIRRINPGYEKRADGEWVRLINDWDIALGDSAVLVMESLRSYGADDYGTTDEEADPYTTRITSTVTRIWED